MRPAVANEIGHMGWPHPAHQADAQLQNYGCQGFIGSLMEGEEEWEEEEKDQERLWVMMRPAVIYKIGHMGLPHHLHWADDWLWGCSCQGRHQLDSGVTQSSGLWVWSLRKSCRHQ